MTDLKGKVAIVTGASKGKHYNATKHPIIEGYDPPQRLGLVLCR